MTSIVLSSCIQSAKDRTEQRTDSIETKNCADTLRLVMSSKSLTENNSTETETLRLPLDSIMVEMVNNTDSICVIGEAYTIEYQTDNSWTSLPVKQRGDGAVYAFPAIGYELPAHSSHHLSVHMLSDLYDFEPGHEYRIRKEYFFHDELNPHYVYGYFKME